MSFKRALYAAYLSGTWNIVNGPHQDTTVHFLLDGRSMACRGANRYAMYWLANITVSNGNDAIWPQQNPWEYLDICSR